MRSILPLLSRVLLMTGLLVLFCNTALGVSVEDFLGTRKVVGVIPFQVGSFELDQAARKKLDSLVTFLKDVDPEKKVVRLEGFTSPEGADGKNIDLSMKRAMAVENYLRSVHHLPLNRYLVGRGVWEGASVAPASQRRVEVVFYDNLLNMEDAEVDKLIIDGHKK